VIITSGSGGIGCGLDLGSWGLERTSRRQVEVGPLRENAFYAAGFSKKCLASLCIGAQAGIGYFVS